MKQSKGFSLLELLIAMAISIILLCLAYPAYNHHWVRARRNQATVTLLYLASQMESFYTLHDSYEGATLDILGVNPYNDDLTYQFSIDNLSDLTYLVKATPIHQQAKQDTLCGTLSLNEAGEQMNSGNTNIQMCW